MKNIGSKIIVLVIVLAMGSMYFVLRWYFDERGKQAKLAEIECTKVMPGVMEFQGEKRMVAADTMCLLMKTMAAGQALPAGPTGDTTDPWHYYGRIIVRITDDVWFVVLRARASEGYRPQYSLRHRKGNGWTVVGDFDAEPVLRQLGLQHSLDMDKLRSPASLTPTDQSTPM